MSTQYYATDRKVGDGSTVVWSFAFAGARPDSQDGTAPYLQPEDVRVALVERDEVGRETRIPLDRVLSGPSQVTVDPPIPAGQEFVVYRQTLREYPVTDFTDFTTIDERDLDFGFRQAVFLVQEAWDRVLDAERAAEDALGAIPIAEEALALAQEAVVVAEDAQSQAGHAVVIAQAALERADQALVLVDQWGTSLAEALAQEVRDRRAADLAIIEMIQEGTPPPGEALSPVMYHSQTISIPVVVPDNHNAASFGPSMQIGDGASVEVGEDSVWTILE